MSTPALKPIIFISYADADEPEMPADGDIKWLSFVTGHLRPAEEIGAFEIWTEPLVADGDLDPVVERKLRACDIFVPLVSPHSLAFETVVDRQIAIIRERQGRGEDVYLYPLLLTPTPETALDENLRPPGGRLFSSCAPEQRSRQMLDAADEIVDIAADAAALKKRRRSRSPPPPPISPALPTSPQRPADRRRGQKHETKDEGSLDVWLTRQSPQVAAAIAARVALRLAPFVVRQAPKGRNAKDASAFLDLTSEVFRVIALVRVVAKYPNHANELRDVALVAAARGGAAHRPDVLALAAYAAALDSPFATASTLPPPFAAAYVAAAAAADPDLRLEIRFDASALPRLGARKLADLPLWSESLPAWWHWESLKAALPSDEGWDVWIEWYEERLRGGSRGEAYELVFASVPPDVLDKGPAAANAWIRAHLAPDSGGPSLPDRPRRLPKPA